MSQRNALHLIDPTALCSSSVHDCDAQALALLELLCGRDPRAWSRELHAVYYAEDRDSAALALALGDRLWLRARALFSPQLPAPHWAGALDELSRQHADGAVIVVAPRAATDAAAQCLLALERARAVAARAAGIIQITLHAEAS
jgi:hypothetical protein